ncbi:MAG: hydroxyacid dehydrogenase [Candidatus Delongbacteria bacterium]|nr:hydroxyacid dehydrogenase [Candidatus Delongbacteria bacterium]MBN2836143.1 hydroxyacid dehydrogenase [Candidatus Delongbacteria bacterium]
MKIVVVEPLGIDTEEMKSYEEIFQELGHDLVFYDHKVFGADLVKRIHDADIIVVANQPIDGSVLSECSNLKMISVAFTGVDHIDLDFCKSKKIMVSNSAGYCTTSVAELTIGLMLSISRSIVNGDFLTRNGYDGKTLTGFELKGKRVGIIGTGKIGTEVARILTAFGVKILGFGRTENKEFLKYGEYYPLDEILTTSDFVSVHLPLTKATENFLSEEMLNLMKSDAVLINTSRGKVVDNNYLYHMLKKNKIQAAALDVFDVEPPLDTNTPLLSLKNCVLTPHIGYSTKEAITDRAKIVFNNILAFFKGEQNNKIL